MKKQIIVCIDTSQINTVHVAVKIDGKRTEKTSDSRIMKSETIVPLIEQALGDMHLTVKDISAITVVTGPGSYTGLRVGLSVANMLGALLGVPVNGKKTLVTPTYS